MFAHLDRISEDDDQAFEPVELPVYIRAEDRAGSHSEVSVHGYPQLLVLPTDSLTACLRRPLQTYVDGLRNSEAATFLLHNRNKGQRTKTHEVTVRVPRAIADAVTAT